MIKEPSPTIPLLARCARFVLHSLPIYNGKGRLIDRTVLGKLQFDATTLDVRALDGLTIRVIPNDLIGRQIFLTGCFDRSVSDVLFKLSRPGDTFWDIGANIGYISCTFLHRVKNSQCLSIEPLPDIYEILRHNLQQFGTNRAQCLMAAVSDHPGSGQIVRTDGNIGHSHLLSPDESPVGTTPVSLVNGQNLASKYDPPNLIKIDVEGHELQVINGLIDVIATKRPRAIVFETHDGWPKGELAQTIYGADYRLLCIAKHWNGWMLVEADSKLPAHTELSNDFVAVPSSDYKKSIGLSRNG